MLQAMPAVHLRNTYYYDVTMRRTKQDADKTRAAILEAAETLFLEQGVANTSLEQIARKAGVTRGAVYWHFKNKADLFHAMLNQVRLPAEQIAARIRLCDPQDPVMGLRNLCCEVMANLVRDARKQRIFTILMRRCEFTDELREAEQRHQDFINQFIDLCTELFTEPAVAKRLQTGLTPRLAAVALHSLLIGLLNDWLRDPELLDAENTQPYLDCLLRGIFQQWPAAAGNHPPQP